jgi:hypothetical protein
MENKGSGEIILKIENLILEEKYLECLFTIEKEITYQKQIGNYIYVNDQVTRLNKYFS